MAFSVTTVSFMGGSLKLYITEVHCFCRSDPWDGDSNAEENLPIPLDGGLAYWHPVLPDPTV